MGFMLSLDTAETVKVIVHKDSSIAGVSDEVYQQYLKNLDESLLPINGEPTRFVLKKTLEYKDTKHVMNSQVDITEDGKPKMNMSFMLDEVRCALVGMEGPGEASFRKGPDGKASQEVVNALYNAGVVMDLYTGRKAGTEDLEAVKKS